MHFYYDKSNQVVMRSEGPIDAPQFRHVEIQVSDNEHQKLKDNCKSKIENGMLVIEMSDAEKSEIKQQARDELVSAINNRVQKQKDPDTKQLLDDIMKLITP